MEKTEVKKKEDFSEKNNFFFDDEIILNFSLANCQKDIFYKIILNSRGKSLGDFTKFETEEIQSEQDNSEIQFKKKLTCNYYFYKKQIIYLSVKKGISIKSSFLSKKYERLTVLSSLVTAPNAIYERNIKENDYYSEKLIVKLEKKSNNIENFGLFDYIKSGIRIACHISLDLSNGENRQFISHNSERDNNCIDYSNIIENITDIISNYIPNRLVHVYGIGGDISYGYNSQKVFKINMGGNDSYVLYNRVLEDYHNSQNEIKLGNKVYFSPLINKVNNYIFDSNELNYYNILFILTKETIDKNDIKKTYDSIIDSSYLPVSIIIIGIGRNNYDKMKTIFDSVPINSSFRKKKIT